MLKKIPTKELKMGMYVADVGRGWFNHPWTTKSKVITKQQEIQELLECGITEVIADIGKMELPQCRSEIATSSKAIYNVSAPAPPESTSSQSSPSVVTADEELYEGSTFSKPHLASTVEAEMPRAIKVYSQALDTSKAMIVACRMNKKIEVEAVQESVDSMIESVSRNHGTLMALTKLRRFDNYTYTHCLNVSVFAISAGKALGLSDNDLRLLGLGTMLHDLGKTNIPAHILNKPGKLTDDEFEVMRGHAALSGQIIVDQKLPVDELVYKIARHHHERFDGTGYPDSLQGDDIPYLVTICSLADVYDALTSDRVYHKGRPPHDALKFIYSLRGTHFKESWVECFIQSVGIYPLGTIVRLTSNQVGVVVGTSRESLNLPSIKLVADAAGMIYRDPYLVDLANPTEAKGVLVERVIPREEAGFDPAYYLSST